MAPKKGKKADKGDGEKKAGKVAKGIKQAVARKTRKIRTNVHFFRPKTLIKKRDPKYPRKSTAAMPKLDKYQIIKYPLTTESAMKKIEEINTLVFLVDIQANKRQIKEAVKSMYDVQCQ